MSNDGLLERIVASKREECSSLRRQAESLRARAEQEGQAARGFRAALLKRLDDGKDDNKGNSKVDSKDSCKTVLICESKRASPSAGLLNEDISPAAFAASAECGGATCLSVLTDAQWFHARAGDLARARAACKLPILRKDFIIDSLQVYESRLLGADCILLIMRLLDDAQAKELEDCALALGMDVLVEVHDAIELERALGYLRADMIGVNSRDLQSLTIDLPRAVALLARVPRSRIAIAESGIREPRDLLPFMAVRESSQKPLERPLLAFLIGEAIMRAADPQTAIRDFCKVQRRYEEGIRKP